ncbi:zinc finger protein DHHC domain containing protein, putative [Entamoeba invadens IP1]|uniref:zinc finger protein DHHC domain containing protein, putative n=1 Tax=Entamoeba invadens IP1 TaxID=370355 RepID=UPI0002C3D0B6|nr:zinc finger protein DHHC domain containing protein, putative [Entamoeba invadens IP1]ELP85028.1 zinc finger protein DHHC domain containing protein, putative [Entamoeba invadens IP1]|eukprot:XP_004184374.1 zinc finger protein DHHC domain containing protein, putative [Entamoeba invadens IP1]
MCEEESKTKEGGKEFEIYCPINRPVCEEGYEIEDVELSDHLYIVVSKVLMYSVFVLTAIGTVQTYFGRSVFMTIFGLISFALFLLLTYCHYKAIHTSPGVVKNYVPNYPEQELQDAINRVNIGIKKDCKIYDICYPVRWCPVCNSFRPPRSYHCKKCGCCVEKRDHHCPWVNSCVGKNNMKFFLQFMFYASITLFFAIIINGSSLFHAITNMNTQSGFKWSVVTVIVPCAVGTAVSLALFTGIFLLFLNYVFVIGRNETSMESIEISKLAFMNSVSRDVVKERLPKYTKGAWNNFKEVLGPTPIDCICAATSLEELGYWDGVKALRKEFPYLDGNVYLDYTAAGLHQISQLKDFYYDLASHIYGNAHSISPSSKLTDGMVKKMRKRILKYFNANEKEYDVVFTSGATEALKTVGENFPFTEASVFLYLLQNHNSVLGIREYASKANATWGYFTEDDPEQQWRSVLNKLNNLNTTNVTHHLIAFPGEDNFNGAKFPLDWICKIQSLSNEKNKFYVLLDAAALVPSAQLDLTKYHPDFVSISFYKMFGFPTGVGALIIKKEVAKAMKISYFGGGTVVMAAADRDWKVFPDHLPPKYEAGTLNFHGILGVKHGFKHFPDIKIIQKHTYALTRVLYTELLKLAYSNGTKAIEIYGNHKKANYENQGPVVTFNVLNSRHTYDNVFPKHVPLLKINQFLAAKNIHVRIGCTCNPGSCLSSLNVTSLAAIAVTDPNTSIDTMLEGKQYGAVRVSIGYPTTIGDIRKFVKTMKEFIKLVE